MEYKEMRADLRDKGIKPLPLKNTEMYKVFLEHNPDYEGDEPVVEKNTKEIVEAGEEWTYVGFGDTPPHMVNYMGMQVFVRGQPVMVTDERVLAKINNRCFVKGKANMEDMYAQDELAKKRADNQRQEDIKTQIMVDRANRKG